MQFKNNLGENGSGKEYLLPHPGAQARNRTDRWILTNYSLKFQDPFSKRDLVGSTEVGIPVIQGNGRMNRVKGETTLPGYKRGGCLDQSNVMEADSLLFPFSEDILPESVNCFSLGYFPDSIGHTWHRVRSTLHREIPV